MHTYEKAFASLNPTQKKAVETIEGPVLVIAGPGTGKTQLLTTRIAHILAATDTLPQNILCLTFTDSAAQTMRERLTGMIGQAAYDVHISTYHAFGAELIRRFPDYFVELGDTRPVDELGIDSIFREVLAGLPYNNPLKFADVYLPDVKTFVSNAKRALLTPGDIRTIAAHNDLFLQKAQPIVGEALNGVARIDKKAVPAFENLLTGLAGIADSSKPVASVLPLSAQLLQQLQVANDNAAETGKTIELTKWKNNWLVKDEQGQFIIDGQKANQKLRAAADIYEQYLAQLAARGLFDYDDMILRAIKALQDHADLRYTLQERYLYIMLDEFQDTNGAQLKLVKLLTDNPVHESRPNILAVGDDDQAIYAFQGANHSHMLEFQQMYRDVLLVALTENYRSHQDILDLAQNISGQIEERIVPDKPLVAAGQAKNGAIERREAKSDVAQFAWTAQKIKELIADGTSAGDIAVLAPKHKHLEPLVSFLQKQNIPIRYEKRENVLDDQAINQLLRMSELCLALANNNGGAANALWAEVLSFPCWNLPTTAIWNISWQANDTRRDWTAILMDNPAAKYIALFFIRLSMLAKTETLETMLDYLIGTTPLNLQEPDQPAYTSPFYEYHFSIGGLATPAVSGGSAKAEPKTQTRNLGLFSEFSARERSPETAGVAGKHTFWNLLTNLTVLRSRLGQYNPEKTEPLKLADLTQFVQDHRAASIKILNTSPYQEAEQAVQLMTTYKAKGQEFAAVFVLATSDEVWGNKARNQTNRLSLPANLQFIRYAGATSDERLRLFYVAITRAKSHLYLVNYTQNYAGKNMTRLKYLSEADTEDGHVASPLLPNGNQLVLPTEDDASVTTDELATYWQQRHESAVGENEFRALLQTRLERFQLSPTHVNSFIDLEKQGPQYFFMNTILRFPRAPAPAGEFGSAIHETLEWLHRSNKKEGAIPSKALTLQHFEKALHAKRLSSQDLGNFLERGKDALSAYLKQRSHTIAGNNESEMNFANEGVFIGNAHMGGKIDKLIIDKMNKTITIVDFKTGAAQKTWAKSTKMYRYRQQLYLYKTLVEHSNAFKGYKVVDAYVEFVEPDEQGIIHELHLSLSEHEQKHAEELAEHIWQHIKALDFPDVSSFPKDLKGIEQFEASLLEKATPLP